MTRVLRATFVAALFALVAGCAPDPSKVCDHMMNIMKDDPEKPGFLDDEDSCYNHMEKWKQRHGVNSYRRLVECSLGVDTSYKLRTCIQKESARVDGPKVM